MILYSDDSILIINKPAGLLSVQDGYQPQLPTLRSVLEPDWGRLYIVHRLDKETSGVIVLARTADAHKNLDRQFAERQITKHYHAVCIGTPGWFSISINAPLKVNGDRRHRTIVSDQGKPALTELSCLRKGPLLCLVQAAPHTGYTHQIRAHCASAGIPLLGDPLYAYPPSWHGPRVNPSLLPPCPRTALHAASIHFNHPLTGQSLDFSAPYPDDFAAMVAFI